MDRYGDSEWLGYSGTDAVFVFDFGQSKHINKCQTRFFNAEGQWIYLPKNIAISTSQDGHTFSPITTVDITSDAHTKVATVDIPLPYTTARYLKIHIENYGIIPESKQGRSQP